MIRNVIVGALCASLCASFAANAAIAQAVAPAAKQNAAILQASRTSPEAFVRALLKIYEDGNTPLERLADNRSFFTDGTAALIARIDRKNQGGAFNADPFCDCQDWISLKVRTVQTRLTGNDRASVRAALSGDRGLTQDYRLVRQPGGWRLEDIVHPTHGSMTANLRKAR
jgi:hypothetical protein